jgi:hypothetical protein
LLFLLGLPQPAEMTGRNLLVNRRVRQRKTQEYRAVSL